MTNLQITLSWGARAASSIPLGSSTSSKRLNRIAFGVQPNAAVSAKGAHFRDCDGNRWLDFQMGLGSVVLGYGHPATIDAIRHQASLGTIVSVPSTLEIEVAERLLCLFPEFSKAVFARNGSDVTSAAVRLARAHTQRDKIIVTGYHGWHDWSKAVDGNAAGIPKSVRSLTEKAQSTEAACTLLKHLRGEVACVVLEPSSLFPIKDDDVRKLHALCQEFGTLLIIDEIVSGFRFGLRGYLGKLGLRPDLACFGKALGNGTAISALLGTDSVMDNLPETAFTTTLGGEGLSLAAANATINELRDTDSLQRILSLGEYTKRAIGELLLEKGLKDSATCEGHPTVSKLVFLHGRAYHELAIDFLARQLARNMIFWQGQQVLSAAHTTQDIEKLVSGLDSALHELKRSDLSSSS